MEELAREEDAGKDDDDEAQEEEEPNEEGDALLDCAKAVVSRVIEQEANPKS